MAPEIEFHRIQRRGYLCPFCREPETGEVAGWGEKSRYSVAHCDNEKCVMEAIDLLITKCPLVDKS